MSWVLWGKGIVEILRKTIEKGKKANLLLLNSNPLKILIILITFLRYSKTGSFITKNNKQR
jgi:hypothetical protein